MNTHKTKAKTQIGLEIDTKLVNDIMRRANTAQRTKTVEISLAIQRYLNGPPATEAEVASIARQVGRPAGSNKK